MVKKYEKIFQYIVTVRVDRDAKESDIRHDLKAVWDRYWLGEDWLFGRVTSIKAYNSKRKRK